MEAQFELSCSGPFTRRLLKITDQFYYFILIFIIDFDMPRKFLHISARTAKWTAGNTKFAYNHVSLE